MLTPTPDTTRDVPYISGRILIIMHICIIAFIVFVHWFAGSLN